MNPFFSVVIPLYNKENFIAKTLESVLAQNFSDFEIIVVNDGSTDDGLKRVEKIQDVGIDLIHRENKGASVARNLGIEKARGKYIALLDADDYWYPNHLEELKKLIGRFPGAGLYCNSYEISFGDGKVLKPVHRLDTDQAHTVSDYFAASMVNTLMLTPTIAFSKKAFYHIGNFDTEIRSGQDIDFFIRAALKVKIAFNPVVTVRYNKTTENNLAKSHFNDDRIYLINKFKAEEKQNPSLKKYLDVNRYAVALRCKLRNMPEWKKLVQEINPKNLNAKQKFLLNIPKAFLLSAIKFQQFLIKKGIYWTAFK